MAKNALLEIGTEEIPASYIEPAREQLGKSCEEFLNSHKLSFGQIKTYATPRRIALYIENLVDKSEDRIEEIMGPSVKAGKDANGNFTPASNGFAQKHCICAEKLAVKTTEKGEYFCVQKKIPGEKTETLLKTAFPKMIKNLYFPKTMVWEQSCFRFARPIRTIIALYGEKTVKFTLADIKSANYTVGLHATTSKKIIITHPERYVTVLQNNCVIVRPEERKEVLRKIIDSTVKRIKCAAIVDESLLDEVNYLVEHPVAVLCRFDERYLILPPEVLITCLRKKQKCFAVEDAKGGLTNYFVGIRNGISENQDIVKEGYERVLSARLNDAEFFFHQDTNSPLISKTPKLKGINFQEKLGTVYDKVIRLKQISKFLNNALGLNVDEGIIEKGVELSKADLVTNMIFEYPELQGIMGRIYAKYDNEPDEVCNAIEEHYLPLTNDGKLPKTQAGILLSISDKLDTLTGDFSAGLAPSGSADPYGLRRMATGVLRIMLEKKLSVSIRTIVEKAFSLLPEQAKANGQAIEQVLEFFKQRLENLWQGQEYRFDEIRAVISAGYDNIIDADMRLSALKQIRQMPDFDLLAGAFKRASNILKQADKLKIKFNESVNEELFREEAEKKLYLAVKQIESEIQSMIQAKQYLPVLKLLVGIKPSVDEFFDKVMVMCDDESIKANRLTLLNYISKLFFRLLDFSQLQG